MNTLPALSIRAAAFACALLALPLAAAAQDAAAQQGPRTQGPMIVERVKSGFLVTPELKFTEFDHRTSQLVGADGGWLAHQSFFIGGGGYWLVNGGHDRSLAYGGLVLGLFTPVDRPFSFGVKTLIGGGHATVTRDMVYYEGPPSRPRLATSYVRYHDEFAVVEPGASAVVRIGGHVRVSVGVGYRWMGNQYGYGYDDYGYGGHGLSGATYTVGVQIGGG